MKSLLPIGSVVLLKNANKRLMICGRVQTSMDSGKVFDYSGCLYPEGFISAKEMYMFNNEDIEKLYYIGMQDAEEFALKAEMKRYLQEKQKASGERHE